MVRNAAKFALVCCAVWFIGHAQAATIDPRLARDDVCGPSEVLHINGINTALEGARSNLRELSLVYGNAHNEHLLRYGLAYNRTNWIIADIQQSFTQLIADYPGVTFSEWLQAVVSGIWPDSLPAAAIADIAGRIGNLLGLNRQIATNDPDLVRMLNEIRVFHRNDARMTMVGHSQGSIYANVIYDRITDTSVAPVKMAAARINVMDVAAAVETIRGGGEYVTSSTDLVVNLVRLVAGNTLGANLTLAPSFTDWRGHSFIAIYLAQALSRDAIVRKLETQLTIAENAPGLGPFVNTRLSGSASWLNCTPTAPCVLQSGTFFTPVVGYRVVGGASTTQWRPGSKSELPDLARAQVQACYAMNNDAHRARPTGPSIYISNCSSSLEYPHITEYVAWAIYSSDAMLLNENFVDGAGVAYVTVTGQPYCRPPTI